nr:DM13 domain-containing protein [Anaerolineae bacterium]
MNTQRWIALGIAILLVICAATYSLWLPALLGSEGEATPTPESSLTEETVAGQTSEPAPSVEPTMDPVLAQLLSELEIVEMGPGLDPYVAMIGDFVTIDNLHRGEGRASIWIINENQRVVRLDPFDISDGPDLILLLSQHPTPRTSSEALLPDYVNLGELQSPLGVQNYPIPRDVVLYQYKSIVVYSMSLNVVYTTATLEEVRGQ